MKLREVEIRAATETDLGEERRREEREVKLSAMAREVKLDDLESFQMRF